MPQPPPQPMRVAVVLASAMFCVLGACITLPGTLLPLLVEQFGMRLVEAGSMLALQPVGYLLAVPTVGWLLRRFGMRRVLSGSVITFATGIGGFGLSSNSVVGAATLFVSGLGFGVMEVAGNALVITVGGSRRANVLNFVHLFFGVGAFVTPALAARAVASGFSWRVPFLVAATVMAIVGVGWNRLRVADEPADYATSEKPAPFDRRDGILLALLLGAYVGAETGIGGWLTKYMVGERGVTLSVAGATLSLYWLGLAAGRLALTVLAHRLTEERLLIASAVLATVVFAIGLLMPTPWLATACFAATGLGFAGIFPGAMALAGRRHPRHTAEVTSVMIAGAGVGGIVVPWVMSAVADGVSLVAGMAFYGIVSASMVVLAAAIARVSGQHRPGAHLSH